MWESYRYDYGLRGRVLSLGKVIGELPTLRRYRLVVIDESHNLRNRNGRRYRAIQEYVRANESKCILLSATPYNKTYLDLSSQLRIFVEEDQDLGIRPERYISTIGGPVEFSSRHQDLAHALCPPFDFSEYAGRLARPDAPLLGAPYPRLHPGQLRRDGPGDWPEVHHLRDGTRSFFPTRVTKDGEVRHRRLQPQRSVRKAIFGKGRRDHKALEFCPRYGLGNYVLDNPETPPTNKEEVKLTTCPGLASGSSDSAARTCSSAWRAAVRRSLQSVERHVLRNYVFLHAIRNDLPLPLGTQDAEMLDSRFTDEDADQAKGELFDPDDDDQDEQWRRPGRLVCCRLRGAGSSDIRRVRGPLQSPLQVARAGLFKSSLASELLSDSNALLDILQTYGDWDPAKDPKLDALNSLVTETFPDQRCWCSHSSLIRLTTWKRSSRREGLRTCRASPQLRQPYATSVAIQPVQQPAVWPGQTGARAPGPGRTDVLSEGQNLQDSHIVVNYDLPWAIIRLIQRAGRVDRIGQKAEEILCHSFLPAEGVERIIDLRGRVKERLRENAEVVGTDEAFFEDEDDKQTIVTCTTSAPASWTAIREGDVDLASHAYQIWKERHRHGPVAGEGSGQPTGRRLLLASAQSHRPAA